MNDNGSPYKVHLPIFEGPLDLLLHLIKINEIDIYDIPISVVTEQYLQYLALMQEVNIDVASEYLVMAATLAHIKSKMLLPSPSLEDDDAGEDPRTELVQRLLEYQCFKKAAEKLSNQEILGRDVFTRSEPAPETEDESIEEASLFDLLEALRGILGKIKSEEFLLDFKKEKISFKDKTVEILEKLAHAEYIVLQDLFSSCKSRLEIIVTFVAMLELIRSQRIRALQLQNFGSIRIALRT
ncbi:MAG: segregation/condensation protein A [Deltaproteobacteria bacterium]|nr:segregation/condensation protein A [Deltaproteobacteria bacterium]